MREVALFFTWREFGAGTTTFTAHLYKGFEDAGYTPYIFRVRPKTETFTRKFAQFEDVYYRNVSPDDAVKIARSTPSLLCSPCPAKHLVDPEIIHKLIKAGMRVVIHGVIDKRIHARLGTLPLIQSPFVVRPALAKLFDRAYYIPHPYVRAYASPPQAARPKHAISIARTTFVKNTHIILEANKYLLKPERVELRGTVDRMYVRHKLRIDLPSKEHPSKGFPPMWDKGAVECSQAMYAVDMSSGSNHVGGGTQYTFLEAWDGGAINIINKDWLDDAGVMKHQVNCYAVASVKELANTLQSYQPEEQEFIRENGSHELKKHEARKVAKAYWGLLNK